MINDYIRGLRASFSGPALVAVGWSWAATLVMAALLTTLVFTFVSGTVGSSAMAEQLREGMTGSWIVDLTGTPGTQGTVGALFLLAIALAPLYLVLAVFLSGGVVAGVERALGIVGDREPRTFFSACGRYVGPMFRLALVEIVILGIAITVLFIVRGAGTAVGLGNWFAWGWLAASLVVLAIVTAVFDFARVEAVARDTRQAISSWVSAIRFAGRRAPAFLGVVVLNLLLALVVAGTLIWLHGRIDLSTGGGVFLGIVVGQIAVLGRIWARVAAYATEAALWQTSDLAAVAPRPLAVEPAPEVEPVPSA